MTSSLELPRFISQQHHHHHPGEWMLNLALACLMLIVSKVPHSNSAIQCQCVAEWRNNLIKNTQSRPDLVPSISLKAAVGWPCKIQFQEFTSTLPWYFVHIWSDQIPPVDRQSMIGGGRSKRKPNRTFKLTHIALLWSYSLCRAINIWQEKISSGISL